MQIWWPAETDHAPPTESAPAAAPAAAGQLFLPARPLEVAISSLVWSLRGECRRTCALAGAGGSAGQAGRQAGNLQDRPARYWADDLQNVPGLVSQPGTNARADLGRSGSHQWDMPYYGQPSKHSSQPARQPACTPA